MIILRFNDSPEHTGLKKAVTSIVTVHYIERIQVKICKGKRCMGQRPRETTHELPAVSSQWNPTDSTSFSQ